MKPERDADDPRVGEVVPGEQPALGVGPGHTVGLMITSPTELITPTSTPVTAPAVLKRRHVKREQQRREVGAGRHGERQADHERDVQALAADHGDRDRDRADRERGDLRDPDLLGLGVAPAPDDVRPDVVRDGARRRDHQAGHHRQDRRERDAGDDRLEELAAEVVGEQRQCAVAGLARRLLPAWPRIAREPNRARWSSRRTRRSAPSPTSPTSAPPWRPDREEPHQDVRQPGGAEHQAEPERHRVERRRQEQARLEVGLTLGRLRPRVAVTGRSGSSSPSPAPRPSSRARPSSAGTP